MSSEHLAEMGALQATYRGNFLKLLGNLIIGGGMLFFGIAGVIGFLQAGELSILTALFAALALIGLLMLWFGVIRLFRKKVKVFEHGLELRLGSAPRFVRYKDVTDLAPLVGRVGLSAHQVISGSGSRISQGYRLFLNEDQITLKPEYFHWDKLTGDIERRIVAARVPMLLEKLERGEKLQFEVKTGPYFDPRAMTLALTREGLQVNSFPPIAWENIRITVQANESNTLVARIQTSVEPVTFMVENFPSLAYHVIDGYLRSKQLKPMLL